MVYGIIGENCSGKSTLAEGIKEAIGAEIIAGKDYLRMAKSESAAVVLFKERLLKAVSGENIIYVRSEPEQIELLPDGTIRILVYADIDTIKERFKARMHGNLPDPRPRRSRPCKGCCDIGRRAFDIGSYAWRRWHARLRRAGADGARGGVRRI